MFKATTYSVFRRSSQAFSSQHLSLSQLSLSGFINCSRSPAFRVQLLSPALMMKMMKMLYDRQSYYHSVVCLLNSCSGIKRVFMSVSVGRRSWIDGVMQIMNLDWTRLFVQWLNETLCTEELNTIISVRLSNRECLRQLRSSHFQSYIFGHL